MITVDRQFDDYVRGIKDRTKLVIYNVLAFLGLLGLIGLGLLLAGLGGATGCSHIPTLPDLPAITNAIPDLPGTPTTTTTTTTTTVPPANPHAMTLKVTKLTTKSVSFDWQPRPYNWPSKTVKVRVDAEVWMNGKKFDWIRAGGQATKGLENVHNGYNGHTVPAPGEAVTFRWVSIDGKQRSNDAAAVWPTRSWWRFWE
jgi:hypothetical protein